jgi:hypothetical protein
VRVAITGCGGQPRDYSLGDIGDGTEGGELEGPPPSKIEPRSAGEARGAALGVCRYPYIRCFQTLDPGDDHQARGVPSGRAASIWGRALATGWT